MIFKAGQLFTYKVNNIIDMDSTINSIDDEQGVIHITFSNFRKHSYHKYSDKSSTYYGKSAVKAWYDRGIIKLIDSNLVCKKIK